MCSIKKRISISLLQKRHPHQSLPHAHREVPQHVLKGDLVGPRLGFMGRICGRIFGMSDFSGSGPEFDPMRSGIVLQTSAVLLKTGMTVHDPHCWPMLMNVTRIGLQR